MSYATEAFSAECGQDLQWLQGWTPATSRSSGFATTQGPTFDKCFLWDFMTLGQPSGFRYRNIILLDFSNPTVTSPYPSVHPRTLFKLPVLGCALSTVLSPRLQCRHWPFRASSPERGRSKRDLIRQAQDVIHSEEKRDPVLGRQCPGEKPWQIL